MPDAAEDLPLATLGDALEATRPGQLGKQSSSLIAKLVSSKMPARFNLKSIRDHLTHNWGLGPSRQTSILLFAMTTEPTARLPSPDAAKNYFDTLTSRYAKSCGLILQAQSSQRGAQQAFRQIIDPTVLEAFSAEQHNMAAKQFKILGEYLNVDPSNDAKIMEFEKLQSDLQERLDIWNSEFSEDFAFGIKPCFDIKKSRRFNSWWNLAREDVLGLYHDSENGRLQEGTHQLDEKIFRITSRSDESLLNLVEGLTALASERKNPVHGFSCIGRTLSKSISEAISQSPVSKFMLPMTGPQTIISAEGLVQYQEVPRTGERNSFPYPELLRAGTIHGSKYNTAHRIPYVHLKSRRGGEWRLDTEMTDNLLDSLSRALQSGTSFAGRVVLVTGAGPRSIGVDLVRGLLGGGSEGHSDHKSGSFGHVKVISKRICRLRCSRI